MHIEVMELIFAKFAQGFLVPGKKVYANGQKAWELTGDGVGAGFNERLIAIHIPCSETKHNLDIQRGRCLDQHIHKPGFISFALFPELSTQSSEGM